MLDSFLGLIAHMWACVPLFAAEVAALAALEHLYISVDTTASMLEGTLTLLNVCLILMMHISCDL